MFVCISVYCACRIVQSHCAQSLLLFSGSSSTPPPPAPPHSKQHRRQQDARSDAIFVSGPHATQFDYLSHQHESPTVCVRFFVRYALYIILHIQYIRYMHIVAQFSNETNRRKPENYIIYMDHVTCDLSFYQFPQLIYDAQSKMMVFTLTKTNSENRKCVALRMHVQFQCVSVAYEWVFRCVCVCLSERGVRSMFVCLQTCV